MTAVHLLREAGPEQVCVTLVEQHARAARGLAYRIWDDSMLLNVPAGNMSALAEEPGHFLAYCRDIDPAFNEGSFVPRRLFGDYLEHTLRLTELCSATSFHTRSCRGRGGAANAGIATLRDQFGQWCCARGRSGGTRARTCGGADLALR
ncbi:FAD/NAD(P)-binding protein [Thauera humireducens]|uniref:FAD/NAD(P)-binding protein n=1 Tax=Thauera humireducens TaxID=1134435 RepID=UPI00311D5BA7